MSEELCSCGEPIAMCPHGVPVPFATYEEKLAFYKDAPARAAARAKLEQLAREAGALRDRLRLADAAHEVGEIAEDFGAELPLEKQIVQVADAVATFAPLIGYVPGLNKIPVAKTALEVMVESAKLLLRAIRGK